MSIILLSFPLDLARGLTQVLTDGTNTYLYGNMRLAQAPTSSPSSHEYFLTDALGSVRQLADENGTLTRTQSYQPYGESLSSDGSGTSSYGFTGEWTDGSGLQYLRARYYAPGQGRFVTKDPSRMETNLYLYADANPANKLDPSGLFSIQQIANSYNLSEEQLLNAFSQGTYNATLRGKWGWLKLLLDASSGESISVGAPGTFPPYLDMFGPKTLTISGCSIMVGGQPLDAFTSGTLNMPLSPSIWWRNTKPNHYFLGGSEYLDADRPRDLPDFRFVGADLLSIFGVANPILALVSQFASINLQFAIDRYGGLYILGSGAAAPNFGGGAISVGEGYVAAPGQIVNQIRGIGDIPSETVVRGTITGWCGAFDINILLSSGGINVCANEGASVVFGYSLGLGGASLGISYGWHLNHNISSLAWHYIDEKPGVTSTQVYDLIH